MFHKQPSINMDGCLFKIYYYEKTKYIYSRVLKIYY